MRRLTFVLAALLAMAASADAQTSLKTFVSVASGNDANTATLCARSAPCRTLTAAYSVTTVNGQITAMDPGGYGTLTITHSINVVGIPGASIGSIPFGAAAFDVLAGPSDYVSIQDWQIDGQNTVNCAGVKIGNATSVTLSNLAIRQCSSGVQVNGGNSVLGTQQIGMRRMIFDTNGSAIIAQPSNGSGAPILVVSCLECMFNGNNNGLLIDGTNFGNTIVLTLNSYIVSGSANPMSFTNSNVHVALMNGIIANWTSTVPIITSGNPVVNQALTMQQN